MESVYTTTMGFTLIILCFIETWYFRFLITQCLICSIFNPALCIWLTLPPPPLPPLKNLVTEVSTGITFPWYFICLAGCDIYSVSQCPFGFLHTWPIQSDGSRICDESGSQILQTSMVIYHSILDSNAGWFTLLRETNCIFYGI